MLSSTAEIDISFESSRNSEWHRLGSYPIRFIFHPKTRGKRNVENIIYPVFRVFNGENWNGLDSNLAYVTRRFESFSRIYWSPLYTKAFTSYKVTTKHVENGTLWFFIHSGGRYIPGKLSKGGWYRLGYCTISSIFTVKHVENGT